MLIEIEGDESNLRNFVRISRRVKDSSKLLHRLECHINSFLLNSSFARICYTENIVIYAI